MRHLKIKIITILLILMQILIGCSTNKKVVNNEKENEINTIETGVITLDVKEEPIINDKENDISDSDIEEWVNNRLNEIENELINQTYTENTIKFVLNNKVLNLPLYGKDIKSISIDTDTMSKPIYSNGEFITNINLVNDKTSAIGYLNINNEESTIDNCVISLIEAIELDNLELKLENEEYNSIKLNDNIENIIKTLLVNNIELSLATDSDFLDSEEDFIIDREIQRTYVDNTINIDNINNKFKINIVTYDINNKQIEKYKETPDSLVGKKSKEIFKHRFILEGTLDNGLNTIIYSLEAVNGNILINRYLDMNK